MGRGPEIRLHELGLSDDIVTIARTHRDLPQHAREQVEAACLSYEEEVAALETQIDNLELPKEWFTRIPLRGQLAAAKERLNACRGLLSVKRRIPFETMAEIFECYLLPDSQDAISEERRPRLQSELVRPPSRKRAAGTLCLVCRYWKTIAMATPSLWSNMFIKAREHRGGDPPLVRASKVRGFLSWMDRVASHPWSLSVQAKTTGMGRTGSTAVPLSQLLHRPAALHLQRLTVDCDQFGVGMGELTFPRLTSIVVWTWRTGGHNHPHPKFPDLPSMPALTQAVLDSVIPRNTLPMDVIPWGQLTHLYLGVIDNRQWKAIMKLCQALQRGAFNLRLCHDIDELPGYPESKGPAVLEHLKELTFSGMVPFGRDGVPMDGLSFPALEKIRLFSSYHELRWEFANAHNIFGALTHLTILVEAWVEGDVVVKALNTVPQLRELYVKICEKYEDLFEYLTYGRDIDGARGGRFRMRHLKALGIAFKTPWYRPVAPGETEYVDNTRPFPYAHIQDLVTSRTLAVRRGDFASVTSTHLQELENLVLAVDGEAWGPAIEERLKEIVGPYTRQSGDPQLLAVVTGAEERAFNMISVDPMELCRWNHWDDGFMDAVDNLDDFLLCPKCYSFL
ncbi:hypothetical protein DFP72DRAFT_941525 [Ephemerocybe angulata]|uniref:F-box domain-containing protein n=1 Tax=Ephemerocybe angulata TaxID=980116 RepID=A0A8H6LUY7_9AGAR|nr:hypothetical protein DFP72DRAFT_941525 [Tulosesus angulatus]